MKEKKETNVTTVSEQWISYWDVYPACLHKEKKHEHKVGVPDTDMTGQKSERQQAIRPVAWLSITRNVSGGKN